MICWKLLAMSTDMIIEHYGSARDLIGKEAAITKMTNGYDDTSLYQDLSSAMGRGVRKAIDFMGLNHNRRSEKDYEDSTGYMWEPCKSGRFVMKVMGKDGSGNPGIVYVCVIIPVTVY